MEKNTVSIKEIFIVLALFVVFFILLNPFGWWMPDMMLAGLLVIALVVFGLFAVFAVRESARDEREAYHKHTAGRAAFVAGTALLAIGMVVQSIHHHVDPWLFVVFVVMIGAKLATRMYIDRIY